MTEKTGGLPPASQQKFAVHGYAEGNKKTGGPLLVTQQRTTVHCYAEGMDCRWLERRWRDAEQSGVDMTCTHPQRTEHMFLDPSYTPSWCPCYPKHTPNERINVRSEASAEQKAEVFAQLMVSVDAENALEKMSNDEIADLLLNHVWGEVNIFSPKSALLSVVVERLRRKRTYLRR